MPLACLLGLGLSPLAARAEQPPRMSFEQAQSTFVLAPLTLPKPANEPDTLRFSVGGLLNLRGQFQNSYDLPATLSAQDAQPGLTANSIDQNAFVAPWFRITPQLEWGTKLRLVGQLDVAQGKVLGNASRDVGADAQPRDNQGGGASWLQPRWLFVEWLSKIGLFRVGQQANHWGMGILANDGNRQLLFGVPRLGQLSERVLFATKPLGEDGPLTTAIAGDLVFRDNTARLSRGDVAWQGVLATYLEDGPNRIGFFGVYRTQQTKRESAGFDYNDDLRVFVFDVAGHTMGEVPGLRNAFWFAEAEAALQLGTASMLRSSALPGERAKVQAYGGAVRGGFVLGAHGIKAATKNGDGENVGPSVEHFGRFVAQLEVGYASGDANPYDGVQKRFTFDPNHRVGLLLFDEVMRWSTARASVAAQDPLLTNAERPQPGTHLLPTNGGVSGAQYVNPTFIVRPEPRLDLRAGMVVAQATSDMVSQLRTFTTGRHQNEFGGDPKRRDLGVELDVGVHKRIPTSTGIEVSLGGEFGVLFPGGALANAAGQTMKTPWLGILQAGLLF